MLLSRWRAAVRAAGAPDAVADASIDAAGTDLLARWGEPQRHYHTVAHLAAVLSVVDAHAGHAGDPELVRLAAWGHDAVYDARAPDNEARSAEVAGTLLAALLLPAAAVAEVRRLILLTAAHDAGAEDRNGALLCDADLAVLAGPPPEYDRYAAAVRREYAHVPDDLFRAGRAAVLSRLLALPALYRVPELRAPWEERARANLRRELARLSR